ncbi:hypothetical protein PFICI_08943 [Pestalotiopsis fici W106-1]|uniref:Fungal N-terminal domain-containing protein n=1 Tax=Pestalotiopsis fici (strain W106-1 / CGMCC3.15140) TaxID=1229662 RepID=W3WZ05_PESFW|nr:uncharacterized protein PFICI_08943 [Pestalotiopsis fici W106-1]ETS79090.1 hypothetical protein PFICI_08943 [Pestalotiopsis fici W106-1]
MDPLSALGAAAASAQFVGYAVQGALKVRKIWQQVKDAPAGIEDLLNHVEREISSLNRLTDPKSPLTYQLSDEQRVHLAPFATDAAEAIKRLEKIIRPLATELDSLKDQHGLHKRFQRSWAKLMTAKTLREIKVNLEVIERLNSTLSRELDREMKYSGSIAQSSLIDQNSQIMRTTSLIATRVDMTNAFLQNIQTSQIRRESELDNSIASLSRSLTDTSQSFASTANQVTDMQDDLGILRQESTNSTQLLSLIQDSISDPSVGLSSKMQAGNELMMQLLSQHQELRNELASALSRPHNKTSSERRSHTTSSPTGPLPSDPNSFSSSYDLLKCTCKRRRLSRFKLVKVSNENGQTRQCPLHGPVRTWNYQVKANLSPFLNGALELTLDFITSRRAFSLSPSLKFRVVVKRSESHLFPWFDGIERILRQRASAIRKESLMSDTMQWSPLSRNRMANITECMSYLVQGVRRSIALGLASGSDTDEKGRTLLFEIFWLLVLLGPERSHFTKEIIELLQLARVSDVDIGATTDMSTWLKAPPGTLMVSTAFLFYQFRLYDLSPVICREFVSFDNLLETTHSHSDNDTDPRFLKLLLANPEVAEAAGYPEFSMAIIRRSLPDTMKLAQQFKGVVQWSSEFWGPELALGWPEGLQFLAEQGFDVTRGLHMAARLGDVESAKILLSTDAPILFSNRPLNSSAGHEWLISALAKIDDEVFRLYAEEVWRRGSELRTLASSYLLENRIDEMVFYGDSSWFGRPQLLEVLSRHMQIPPKLGDALMALPHYILAFTIGDECVRIHQILYDIGWADVDAGYEYGRTPLIEICRHFVADLYQQNFQNWLGLILWFIEKGANADFPASETQRLFWPHLQFYLAAAYPIARSARSRATRTLRSAILESCDAPVVSDGCKCFCSTKGCIAPFLLWRCQPLGYSLNHSNCHRRDRLKWIGLRDWLTAWKLPTIERQRSYREICRLEVFDRLGGRHTCCATYGRISWDAEDETTDLAEEMRQNKGEIAEIRAEDRPLAEQLHLTMYWYKQLQRVLRYSHVFDFCVHLPKDIKLLT